MRNTISKLRKVRSMRVAAMGAAALVALVAAPSAASAQEPIDSTTELKRACEAAVNNFLYVTVDVKINNGPHEDVAGGCQIALGPSASFEADQVSMRFAGPFRIDSSLDRSVSFTNSIWKARSLAVHGGAVSSFKNVASLLQATTGDIEISGGAESSVQLQDRPSASVYGLKAAGSVSITGGEKLFVTLADTGIEGRKGVRIPLGGRDSVLRAEQAEVRSPRGPITISGTTKALVDLKEVTLAAGAGNATVSLGSESLLNTTYARISSEGGSVDLRAGAQGGSFGSVVLADTTAEATHGVRVRSSVGGRWGTVKVARSTLSGGSDLVFGTGELGQTEVKESSLTSGTAIRIFTGAGGTCKAESNAYQAPVRQLCL